MTLGRNKCVIKGASPKHEKFFDRIRKSLYFGCDTRDEDMQVSRPLAEYASELFSEPHKGHSLHRLNRVAAGSVHTTPCSLIMALIYLDRLNATDPCYVRRITPQELFIVSVLPASLSSKINQRSRTIYHHHLLVVMPMHMTQYGKVQTLMKEYKTSINNLNTEHNTNNQITRFGKAQTLMKEMISTKFYTDDVEFNLSDWAEDGNITRDRLKQLEKEFLSAINWNIYISTEQFFTKLANVERTLALKEGLKRGWLTYTELVQMLPSFTNVKFLLNNITVMAVSYTAGVMTIAGAFFLASQLPMTSLQRNAKVSCTDASTDDANTNLLKDSTVLPAAPNLRLTAEQQQQLNSTANSPATISMTSSVTIDIANISCAAFNVEAELLKLERQYQEEALLEELRRRYNEFVADTHNNLFNILKQLAQQRASGSQKNWLSLKDAYSDEIQELRDLSALQALTTTVQRIILIMAFIYGQRHQLKQLRTHLMPPTIWRGHKIDHGAVFLLLQIFIVYKACGSEIFKTTIFLKEFLI